MRSPGPPWALARQPWKAFSSSPWKTGAEQLAPDLLRAGAVRGLGRPVRPGGGAASGAAGLSPARAAGRTKHLRGLETRAPLQALAR